MNSEIIRKSRISFIVLIITIAIIACGFIGPKYLTVIYNYLADLLLNYHHPELTPFIWVLFAFFLIASGVLVVREIRNMCASPYAYPYFIRYFDISGRHNPDMGDYIDRYISNPDNWKDIQKSDHDIAEWKKSCEKNLSSKHLLRNYRRKQFLSAIDDNHAYRFVFCRQQTRYYQKNYQKIPYKITLKDSAYTMSYRGLKSRYNALSTISFECTLNEYNRKQQRLLLTPQLRQYIMKRDNYTCQICGKYMPDGVGLQIDHIIPVSKGGKTVASNLRVLCSRCNGKKGAKYDSQL